MGGDAATIACALAKQAEAVCRTYLPGGRREGRYWIAGDTAGSAGRSLFVRLVGQERGRGAAGKWTDAATGEHGDLLDLIGLRCDHNHLSDTIREARRFLALPVAGHRGGGTLSPAAPGSSRAAHRLWAASRPIAGTVAETYLRGRRLTGLRGAPWLRFHPHCWYRCNQDDAPGTPDAFPALIAAVTSESGEITGLHRTWLDPVRRDKAAVATPRRALGDLLGNGVRFGGSASVMAAGEGLETMLSLRVIAPRLPVIACLSSAHLAALAWPASLRRLYIARDRDRAGDAAWATLADRASATGITLLPLVSSVGSDLNDALCMMDRAAFTAMVAGQMRDGDASAFITTT